MDRLDSLSKEIDQLRQRLDDYTITKQKSSSISLVTTPQNDDSEIKEILDDQKKSETEVEDSLFFELINKQREFIELKSRIPQSLADLLIQLNKLDFTRKEIDILQWEELRGLTNLHTLILDGSPSANDSSLLNLSNLDSLTALNLKSTVITDRSISLLSKLTSLTALDIRNTQITDIYPFTCLTNLKLLDCRNTKVSKEQGAFFSNFHQELKKKLTVKEGYLYKQGALNKNWKKRWIVLQDSHLLYFKNPDNKTSAKGDVKLSEIQVGVAPELKDRPFSFKIETKGRIYYFQAEDRADMIEWLRAIVEMYKYQDFSVLMDSK